ncbi:MAG: PQQ-dependent dehydrogenase, methanol/ethanol family [Pseudomonadales bacterium]|nr:PQQ-dependent dehydrogenase, methanol/ethanol family [Pseudomonadales bacterium]
MFEHGRWRPCTALLLAALAAVAPLPAQAATEQWTTYGRDYTEQRHSPLQQINRANVTALSLDWAFEVPDGVALNSTPLMVNGTLYFSADRAIVHAVDARNGTLRWSYDPEAWKHAPRGMAIGFNTNRGIAWWQGRLFVGTPDGRLVALAADTGKVLWATRTFPVGERKAINGAPRAFDGKVFIGNSGAEFGTRGFVDAYDALTGERLWRFYTVPGNPADGFENDAMAMAAKTWHGQWWKHFGGGTVWNGLTYDPELKHLYVGVGNGDPWDRDIRSEGKGDNLFLSSIVALNADTGDYVWHYQTNPGEQWDYKATADMVLADLTLNGEQVPVLMQAPTNGFFYVLDRRNGKLLGAEKYEKATWAERVDITTGRPVEADGVRVKTGERKLIYPSTYGAHNWQAMAFSPETGLAYIPTMHQGAYFSKPPAYQFRDNFFTIGMVTELAKTEPEDGTGGLVAWDPVTQRPRWRIGDLPIWNGGVLSTAGGLVFHGTAEGDFIAYDAADGKRLWQFNTQRGITAAPITYELDGEQHIALPVGWGGLSSFGLAPFRQHGWKYKGPGIRLLSFSLKGKASLPVVNDRRHELNVVDTGDAPIDGKLAQEGFVLYHQASCAICHGSDAHSVGAAAPDLRESAFITDYAAFRGVVADGNLLPRGMPMFDDLSEREIRAVFEYVRQQARLADQ